MTDEHLEDKRYVDILKQISDGGVNKLIFAGYATDPLNYKYIDNLTQVPLENNQIMGFHTKAIKVSSSLLDQLGDKNIRKGSYFSVSVDAGSVETYNVVHGLKPNQTKFYERVLVNLANVNEKRQESGNQLDLSVTYLLNEHNCSKDEVNKFISDFRSAGVDIIRFTFPQVPRGYDYDEENEKNIPGRLAKDRILDDLRTSIEKQDGELCRVIILDFDKEIQIDGKLRSLPCFARWIFPSIGYDGYLGHCSESAAPHFRTFALGNLNNNDFWDVFYDYDASDLESVIQKGAQEMIKHGCRCDRKEHTVNKLMSQAKL